MTRFAIYLVFAASLALTALPSAAENKPIDSWGRAGVDFETYRNDALECALLGYYADVSETEQAKKFVRATKELQASDDHSMGVAVATAAADNAPLPDNRYRVTALAAQNEQIRSSIRPAKLMQELQHGLVGVVESCLIERGYSQFRLTESQQEQLSQLKKGSDERRQFLYGLASDGRVLEQQALPAEG